MIFDKNLAAIKSQTKTFSKKKQPVYIEHNNKQDNRKKIVNNML